MERLDLNTLDDLVEEQERLQVEADQAQLVLEGLEADLRAIDEQMEALEAQQPQYEALGQGLRLARRACRRRRPRSLLGDERRRSRGHASTAHGQRSKITASQLLKKAAQRQDAADRIVEQEKVLDGLHYELTEAIEAEESFRNEWIVERDDEAVPAHVQVMPWSRGYEEDKRFRKSLGTSLAASMVMAIVLSSIALPIVGQAEGHVSYPNAWRGSSANRCRRLRRRSPWWKSVPVEEEIPRA